jgi:UDPglucose 6-dehydrogenase
MSPESAEMTKYVANALLATKISFINEVANLCEKMQANINDVRRGIGHDARIGFAFLFPGLGYGGSCFPKDVRALQAMARQWGVEPRILAAVDEVNNVQKTVLLEKIVEEFRLKAEPTGASPRLELDQQKPDASACRLIQPPPASKLAIWGLSFKPRTDDIREAPALEMIDRLLELGLTLHVHDPEAMENVRKEYGDRLQYAESQFGPYTALENADGLLICTEWKEYQHPDFTLMRKLMRRPVIFDGRNLYEPSRMQKQGFTYYSIGRATVKATT